MKDLRTDRIAAEAARLLNAGQAQSLPQAIQIAAESLRLAGARLPSPGRVRRHAQAQAMQALGGDGYAASVHGILSIAEEIMTGLERDVLEATTQLVGRGAKGQVDADAQLHIRIYTEADIAILAETMVELGYGEPQIETVETRLGRLNRLRLVEGAAEVFLTRLSRRHRAAAAIDLFSGRAIRTLNLDQLREMIDQEGRNERRC